MRYQIDDNIELLANKILKETKKIISGLSKN